MICFSFVLVSHIMFFIVVKLVKYCVCQCFNKELLTYLLTYLLTHLLNKTFNSATVFGFG